MSGENQRVAEDPDRCGTCSHSVDVRGVKQIVCLVYLEMRDPKKDGGCGEFDAKRARAFISTSGQQPAV